MSHGVTASMAKPICWGEPGGLNEVNSDISGTIVEYDAVDSNSNVDNMPNYVIGERIYEIDHGIANPTQALRCTFKRFRTTRHPAATSATLTTSTCTTHRQWRTIFLPVGRRGSGTAELRRDGTQPRLQRQSFDCRPRPKCGGENLVPRADALPDLEHALRGRPCCNRSGGGRPATGRLAQRRGRVMGGGRGQLNRSVSWKARVAAGGTTTAGEPAVQHFREAHER